MKKRNYFISLIMVLFVMLFGGIIVADAASTTLPDSVVSDNYRTIEYIENFPVVTKTANNGKYYFYCMNMSATYAANVKFTKTASVDDGYIYILNHKPNTGDADKDFYITQMAVWYYEDYLAGKNYNLVEVVKKYILTHREDEEVSKKIYELYMGARGYQQGAGQVELDHKTATTWVIEDGYYVSNEVKVYASNIDGNLSYSLNNAPVGTKVVKSTNGVKVKVPVSAIPTGKKLTLTLNVSGNYTKYTAYYYYNSSKYQKMLFQDALKETSVLKDSISMELIPEEKTTTPTTPVTPEKYTINISKSDVTQSKEIPGATLVVKDESGKTIESWVSTSESHKITLEAGKYSLTETLAPKGYKLSSTTIEFMLDSKGGLYAKNINGVYELVDKVTMINELLDMVSFAKKDSSTKEYVSGAVLAIKDENGNTVKEFTTTNTVYQMELDAGKYTLSEVSAPDDYVLSSEVIYFELTSDGTLKVKNDKGVYTDTAMITYYNTKKVTQTVKVGKTDLNNTILVVSGIALLVGGAYIAKKTIKEC